jgi:hypothetical protein
MQGYGMNELETLLQGNRYPGRGILVGQTEEGEPLFAYFIMGRSAQSRNRVFRAEGPDLFTRPYDPALVSDPSLIIYRAVAAVDHDVVVTNGDQTDTIVQGLEAGSSFSEALRTRRYEPDAPHYTPRISAVLHLDPVFSYEISILRKKDDQCDRPSWSYTPQPGVAHLIHTYDHDGSPLPSFSGEPRECRVHGDASGIATGLWDALDRDNRISLVVRTICLSSSSFRQIICNAREGM